MRSLALIFLPCCLLEPAKFAQRVEVAEGELKELLALRRDEVSTLASVVVVG